MAISPCNSLNVKTLRISQLASSPISSNDLLVISQYNSGVYYSKKATFGNLITYIGSVNASYTGSFYNPDFKSSNFYTVSVRNTLTGNAIIATSGFSGNLTGNVVGNVVGNVTGSVNGNVTGNLTGNITGNITSTGTSTFSSIDVNGGTIDGTIIGATSATTITGTTITATTGFSGNITGNLTGDVYNATTTKVLESGTTTPTANGGVSSAYFLGTSSYAARALTASYGSRAVTASYALNGGAKPSGISGSIQLYKTLNSFGGTSKLRYRSGSLYVDGPVSASALSIQGAGIPQITSATDIRFQAASLGNGTVIVTQSPFRIASFTTIQRNSFVSPTVGDMIFNTSDIQFQGYNGSTWVVLG